MIHFTSIMGAYE